MMQTVSDAEKIAIAQMHLSNISFKLGFPNLELEMKDALESAERLVEIIKTFAPAEAAE